MNSIIVSSRREQTFARCLRLHASTIVALLGFMFAFLPADAQSAPRSSNLNVVPTVTSISVSNGQLFAAGTVSATIKGQVTTVPFSGIPVTLALAPDQSGAGACPILDLTLAPITLDLLGLVVQTSPICLKITAYDGAGLLGDLLCNVANLLNGGLSLSQILAGQGLVDAITGVTSISGLTTAQLNALLPAVQNLLNGALGNLLQAILSDITASDAKHVCSILHLKLGPLNLNLLGLQVDLDDCAGGPVVVDITAENGKGNLLGNLLCGLLEGGSLNLGATLQQILNLLVAR